MGRKAMSSVACCPCRCIFCGLVSCVVSVVACVFVAAGLAVVALYLVFRPHVMRVSADGADLGNFTLEPRTWILHYNLSLDIHFRNPNKRIGIQYERLHAQAFYQGQRIAHADLPDLFQDSGDATLLPPVVFFGQAPLQGGVAAAAFRREAGDNATFSIDVKLDARMKLKLWLIRVPGPNPRIDCQLRIRRRKRATFQLRPGSFSPTQCKVWF
ncbi:hypothetical protein EJB05_10355, partial [Eragrostis curvula]